MEIWPDNPEGWPAADLKYRFNWTFPVAISPHDHNKVYAGSQLVHMTTDGGQSWREISPDLTLNDKSRQGPSGGLTGDNIGPEYAGVLISIAESPKEAGVIWTGSNDGQVQVTRDGGQRWTNVTGNIPNLPAWGTIYTVEPSPHDGATAYITVDLHQENNRDPFVYKTSDYGKTWKSLSATLPRNALSYVHSIKEDPVRRGLLFVGTENGLYVSFDDGAVWQPLQNNLPHVPVYGITVQPHFNDLVVATYGRGIWILDDITPLRQMTAGVLTSGAHLFAPRQAYRFRGVTPPAAVAYDTVDGQNPPYGADLNYFLPSAAAEEPRITITDDKGEVVRTLRGTKEAGVNRVWWDLRSTPSGSDVRLRTSPLYASWMKVGPEGRPVGGRASGLVPPGVYKVTLASGGAEMSQSLTVVKDPSSGGSVEEIRAQTTLVQAVRENMRVVGDMINRLEGLRRQLQDLAADTSSAAAVKSGAVALEQKLTDVEEHLYQLRLTGGQDGMRWGGKLLQKLSHLAGQIQETDYRPTDQQMAVHKLLTEQIAAVRGQFDRVSSEDVARFNVLLKQSGRPALTADSKQ